MAKLISFLISVLHLGQSSNFPGKVALSLNKELLKQFKLKEGCKIILITGTNGKSTTCGILASILKTTTNDVIYNKSGANLLSGIATTLCHYSDFYGNLKYSYLILEVDEATLPLLTLQLTPNIIGVTNFFRDQLDRFGELDKTVKLIESGINNNKNTTVVLNADDPRVAFLKTENKKIYYGINNGISTKSNDISTSNKSENNGWLVDPEEITTCPKCGVDLSFKCKFLAHLGDYKCFKCNLTRPEIDFLILDFKTDHLSINFDVVYNLLNDKNSDVSTNDQLCSVHLAKPTQQKNNFFLSMIGNFNLYNATCAIAIAKTISNVTAVQIQKGFQSYSTIFGRGEKTVINNKPAWIYLIKNPAGATEVLKLLSKIPNARFLIVINDNFADGRDVSWLWDARFDILTNHKKIIYVSGKRALDMAVRLKYANIQPEQIHINESIKNAINKAANSLTQGEVLYILPTYTALLEMQRRGICKSVHL